jgi:hypothetical protein
MAVVQPDIDPIELSVNELIEKGKRRKYLTWEELNETLPDEAISPEKLESVLNRIEQSGIPLIDEIEAERLREAARKPGGTLEGGDSLDEVTEVDLAETATRRVDDPVRMYLTQMGSKSPCSRANRKSPSPRRSSHAHGSSAGGSSKTTTASAGRRNHAGGRRRPHAVRPHHEDLHRRESMAKAAIAQAPADQPRDGPQAARAQPRRLGSGPRRPRRKPPSATRRRPHGAAPPPRGHPAEELSLRTSRIVPLMRKLTAMIPR